MHTVGISDNEKTQSVWSTSNSMQPPSYENAVATDDAVHHLPDYSEYEKKNKAYETKETNI